MSVEGLTEPLVYLPPMLADMFDVPRSEVRQLLASGKVRIDGVTYRDLDVRLERIASAKVRVASREATTPEADHLLTDYPHCFIHRGVTS